MKLRKYHPPAAEKGLLYATLLTDIISTRTDDWA
jgi:hypothetical protein